MSMPDTVPTWPRIEAVAREDGTGEVIVDGTAQHVAAANLNQVRVEIIRAVTNVAISVGRPVRVSTSGPDGYWPLIVYPNGAVTADEDDQPRPGRRAAADDARVADGAADQGQAEVGQASPATPVSGQPSVPGPGAQSADQTPDQVAESLASQAPAESAAGEALDDHAGDAAPTGDHPDVDHPSDVRDAPGDVPGDVPADVAAQAPAAPPEPAQGGRVTSPWPDQAQPGSAQSEHPQPGQPQPGPYGQGPQPAFGQPPAPQPGPPAFGQRPPAGPRAGQSPVGQPPSGQPPVGPPPSSGPGVQPMPQRSQPMTQRPADQPTGQRAAGQHFDASHSPQRSAESEEHLLPQQRQSFLTREQIEEPASRGFRGFLGKVGIKVSPNEDERSERADAAAVSQHWPGPRTIAVVNGKGGAGKSLEINEPVLTPSGYRPIGSLEVGDLVMGRDGLPHPVLGVFPQGRRELFRVTLTDGTSILADADHLWEIQTEADHLQERTRSGNRVLTTAQLRAAGLGVDLPGRGTRHRFFIPVAEPVQFAPTSTTVDPYLLGLLLGDGSVSDQSVRFSTADAELVEAVTATVPPGIKVRYKDRYDYTLTREAPSVANPLRTMLVDLDVARKTAGAKFVPDAYRLGDIATRTAVLQGLLDTDGWVERGVAAGYATVSDRLADDVAFIAQSLGCVVTRSVGISSYTHAGQTRSGQLVHRLRIKAPAGLELFRLERKRTKMRAGQRIPYRAIASIEPAGWGEAVCISVASGDHLFLTRNCVPTHNTPSTVLLSAVFALFGGAGVVAWDNNQTRGTLGWRTEQGQHDSTLLDLLPQVPRLLGTSAQSADLAHFVHHQSRDRYDVLRSKPMELADMQRLEPRDVDAIHAVLGKYYRMIFIDSGNDESDPMWLRMIDLSDQLVVTTTTRDDHAEAGALLLEALAERDERSAALARSSVAIVSQADPSARPADLTRVAAGYQALTRATVNIPFDPAMVDGLLRYGALKSETKRAWLAAAAAVARGL